MAHHHLTGGVLLSCTLQQQDWVYLGADEVEASAMSAHVDVLVARALQAQLVGVAAGRLSVHLHPS